MFDASKVYDEVPLSAAGEASRRLEHFKDPVQFPIQRSQLERDLGAIEFGLNVQAWGYFAADLPAPTPEQSAELLGRFSGPAFQRDLIEAVTLRYLLKGLARFEGEAKAAQEQEWRRIADAETEKADREAFDAYQSAEREKRFQQWRKRNG